MELHRLLSIVAALAGTIFALPAIAQTPDEEPPVAAPSPVNSAAMERSAVERSDKPFLCEKNLIKNGRMDQGIVRIGNGSLNNGSSLSNWGLHSQTPQVYNTVGHGNIGWIAMWGHGTTGESIKQSVSLPAGSYSVSFSAQMVKQFKNSPPRIRILGWPGAPGNAYANFPGIPSPATLIADIAVPQTNWLGFRTTFTTPSSIGTITVQVLNDQPGPSGEVVSVAAVDNICITPVGPGAIECPTNIVQNGEFTTIVMGANSNMPPSTATPWMKATGSPQLSNTMGDGTPGWSLMWGNQAVGESIYQTQPGMFKKNTLGNPVTYKMTVSVKYLPNSTVNPHVWLRVRLSNGSKPFTQIDQPGIQQTVATIGSTTTTSIPAVSGPGITHTGWVNYQITFKADADYDTLILNPSNISSKNDGAQVSWIAVDNVCIVPVRGRPNIKDQIKEGLGGLLKDKELKEKKGDGN